MQDLKPRHVEPRPPLVLLSFAITPRSHARALVCDDTYRFRLLPNAVLENALMRKVQSHPFLPLSRP